MVDCGFEHAINTGMAVDPTLLDGGAGLVRVHEVSDSMEKTTMRSAAVAL